MLCPLYSETGCTECLNGGTFTGGSCDCPDGFSGTYCEVEGALFVVILDSDLFSKLLSFHCNYPSPADEPYVPCDSSCNNGYCDYSCGTCVCHPFYTGEYCNKTLSEYWSQARHTTLFICHSYAVLEI